MKQTLIIFFALFVITKGFSQENDTTLTIEKIESSLKYQTGVIKLATGNATLTVPEGFHFLDKEQTRYVLTELWGNPEDKDVQGMLIPINKGVLDSDSWAFSLRFDEMGYVKDADAEDIDYNDLKKELQNDFKTANPEREKQGYVPIEFVGWASQPHYDKDKKVLYWAKELKFGSDSLNTLNYNLRILGRKGVFELNAIATITELNEVNANLDKAINSVTFDEGNRYADYVAGTDNIAAWTIGGLVAGKVLAKVGFFALILKFWKLVALGFVAIGAGFAKFFGGKKKEDAQ